jgi:hypothetical protein
MWEKSTARAQSEGGRQERVAWRKGGGSGEDLLV